MARLLLDVGDPVDNTQTHRHRQENEERGARFIARQTVWLAHQSANSVALERVALRKTLLMFGLSSTMDSSHTTPRSVSRM